MIKIFQSLDFLLRNISTFDVFFKKRCSKFARECEISDNNRKKSMKVKNIQLFYNYMKEVKIVFFFNALSSFYIAF